MINYRGKKIVIVGLGQTGISCIDFFLSHGVTPRIIDTRSKPPFWSREISQKIECHLGSLNNEWLITADLIVISPGISIFHPSLKAARNAGIEIVGDIELFCREVKTSIIAITGSSGKSTVTTLVKMMAEEAGICVGVGGNIGLPVLKLLKRSFDLYVLEISSFQLEVTSSLFACAATVLNITEDHLDRYISGIQQYRSIKLRIYKNAKTCVVNNNDLLSMPPVSVPKKNCISFGTQLGDYRLNYKNNEIWLHIYGKDILNTKETKLFGEHAFTNALAALALADAVGLPQLSSLEALKKFNGLSYCFQLVREYKGIRWINDSKATNIGSTQAALNNLYYKGIPKFKGILHLLLGGDGKSADFSLLKPYLMNDQMRVYCFGRDRNALSVLRPDISETTETMEQAIHLLAKKLKSGDTVLLSPACGSQDQFKDFRERGEIFNQLARKLG